MRLTNEHNETCTRVITPVIKDIKSYEWDTLQHVIYALFNMTKSGDVDMWYTIILVNDKGNLYFAFTQELDKPNVGSVISYNGKPIKVTKVGRSDGYHGWCKLVIVEGKNGTK